MSFLAGDSGGVMVLVVESAQTYQFEPDISQARLRNPVAIGIDRTCQFEGDVLVFRFEQLNSGGQIVQAHLRADLGAKQVRGSHFVESCCPDDLALPQDPDLVAQTLDFAQDMRTKHDGGSLLMDLLDQLDDGKTNRGVEIFGRFIEDHQGARAAQDAANR